jgi:hypothetical protein
MRSSETLSLDEGLFDEEVRSLWKEWMREID